MSDDRNLGVCPDCGGELTVVDASSDRPNQRVDQECPNCGYETPVVLCHYPDGRFVGIARALDEDTCTADGCDDDARLRYQPVSEGRTETRCPRHVPGHYWRAVADAETRL